MYKTIQTDSLEIFKQNSYTRTDIGSTVSEQVCENDIEKRQVNTFKCLVNGEISLSWNTNNIINL